MTKKSLGRVRRDESSAAIKQQGVYSPYVDLDNMFTPQYEMFSKYQDMANLIGRPDVATHIADPTHVNNLLRTMAADVVDLRQRTEKLHSRHAGKTSMPDMINEDENLEIIMMFQEYQMLFGVHSQVIMPVMLELDEHLNKAIRVKAAIEAQTTGVTTTNSEPQ